MKLARQQDKVGVKNKRRLQEAEEKSHQELLIKGKQMPWERTSKKRDEI